MVNIMDYIWFPLLFVLDKYIPKRSATKPTKKHITFVIIGLIIAILILSITRVYRIDIYANISTIIIIMSEKKRIFVLINLDNPPINPRINTAPKGGTYLKRYKDRPLL